MYTLSAIKKQNYEASLKQFEAKLRTPHPLSDAELEEIIKDLRRIEDISYYPPGKALQRAIDNVQSTMQRDLPVASCKNVQRRRKLSRSTRQSHNKRQLLSPRPHLAEVFSDG